MKTLMHLFHLATGGTLPDEDLTPARRAQLALVALGSSLLMAALWGVAAGCGVPALAVQNLYKLPLILLFSGLGAVPIGLLAWKIVGVPQQARELVHGYALSTFLGTAVLLVLAPLVALYYVSSTAVGPAFAMGTVALSVLIGAFTFVRVVRRRFAGSLDDWRALIPTGVLVLAFSATLWQVIAVFSPILPERTPFHGGIDDALVIH
jgi:hypothetical protein